MTWLALAAVAALQDPAARPATPDAPETVVSTVEVLGRRGAAAFPAERELGADEIDALDATDIGEILQRASEALGASGAPVVIVNGKPVADPKVFYGFPPDALVRVEILPPAASGYYGADPGHRVVNIVLQRRFRSIDGQLIAEAPTAGGTAETSADLRRGAISEEKTSQAGLRVSRQSALRAGDREDLSTPTTPATTLRPEDSALNANLNLSRPLGDWSTSFSATGRLDQTAQVASVQGLPASTRRKLESFSATVGLSGQVRGWSTQIGLDADISGQTQQGYAATKSQNDAIAARGQVNRRLFDLPAGAVVLNLSGRYARLQAITETQQARASTNAADREAVGALSLPLAQLTPDARGLAKAIGQVVLNLGGQVRDSGAGSGDGLNASLSWSPSMKVHVNGTWSRATEAVSDTQRFGPLTYGTPTMVYDFVTGQASEVLPLRGGNPALTAPRLQQYGLNASLGPFGPSGFTAAANFVHQTAMNGISVFPTPTPELEAAFPDRFIRDGAGRLVGLDQRPINLQAATSDTLSSNLGFTLRPPAKAGPPAGDIVRVTLTHTWRLRDEVVIHAGLPRMDRLTGDGGGEAAHQVTISVDGRRGPWGFNATTLWRSGYRIRRDSGRDGPDDLKVDALGTIDLRLSYRLQRALADATGQGPARRGVGAEIELGVVNLMDARPKARLGDGRAAPGYARDDQDFLGRTLRVSLKRRF